MPTDPSAAGPGASDVSGEVLLRPATPEDLPMLAELHLRARAAAYPAMPRGVRPAEQVRSWVGSWDLAVREVWLAESPRTDTVGYAMLHQDWLDDLYVDPRAQGRGVGTALLDVAKARRPGGFCLWVFVSNHPARRFYAGHGLVELEYTDGSANEEAAPDLRMAWPGTDPLAFLRGLIDEVDDQLGDLLARRSALTAAVQPHRTRPGRDPERERKVVEAMVRRAPGLGPDRLARIVDVIITESLDAAERA